MVCTGCANVNVLTGDSLLRRIRESDLEEASDADLADLMTTRIIVALEIAGELG